MCGPSSQEKDLANSNADFSKLLQSNYQTNNGNQQSILSNINRSLTPIVNAGPSQEGYSPAEAAALNTEAINNAGGQAKNLEQIVNSSQAGKGGGGSSGLTSGIQQALNATAASSVANNLSSTQNQNLINNYNTGRQNYNAALAGEEGVASQYSPTALAGTAGGVGSNAFNEASTINQQKQQGESEIAGLATSLGGDALTAGLSSLGGGDSTSGVDWGNEDYGSW